MSQTQSDSTTPAANGLNPLGTPFFEIINKLQGLPAESCAVDTEFVAVLYNAPWSCDAVRDLQLPPLVAKVAAHFGQDRTGWVERCLVNLVSDVAKVGVNLAGFPQEAHACGIATNLVEAHRATERALATLQPFAALMRQVEDTANACNEALDEVKTLSKQLKDLMGESRNRAPLGPYPDELEPYTRISPWFEHSLRGRDGLRTSADVMNMYARELAASADLACYGCIILLNISLRVLLQMQAGELPKPVALSLATYHAGHAVVSAANMLGTGESLEDLRDTVLGAAVQAALSAYEQPVPPATKKKERRSKRAGRAEG